MSSTNDLTKLTLESIFTLAVPALRMNKANSQMLEMRLLRPAQPVDCRYHFQQEECQFHQMKAEFPSMMYGSLVSMDSAEAANLVDEHSLW